MAAIIPGVGGIVPSLLPGITNLLAGCTITPVNTHTQIGPVCIDTSLATNLVPTFQFSGCDQLPLDILLNAALTGPAGDVINCAAVAVVGGGITTNTVCDILLVDVVTGNYMLELTANVGVDNNLAGLDLSLVLSLDTNCPPSTTASLTTNLLTGTTTGSGNTLLTTFGISSSTSGTPNQTGASASSTTPAPTSSTSLTGRITSTSSTSAGAPSNTNAATSSTGSATASSGASGNSNTGLTLTASTPETTTSCSGILLPNGECLATTTALPSFIVDPPFALTSSSTRTRLSLIVDPPTVTTTSSSENGNSLIVDPPTVTTSPTNGSGNSLIVNPPVASTSHSGGNGNGSGGSNGNGDRNGVGNGNSNWNGWYADLSAVATPWSEWNADQIITFTKTYAIPCPTGWQGVTRTLYTTHCGCTETPIPTSWPMTVYTTVVPEAWGIGRTVTVTVPVAGTITPSATGIVAQDTAVPVTPVASTFQMMAISSLTIQTNAAPSSAPTLSAISNPPTGTSPLQSVYTGGGAAVTNSRGENIMIAAAAAAIFGLVGAVAAL